MTEPDQSRTPFLEEVARHARHASASFHMPGHKQRGGAGKLTELLGEAAVAADLSEMGGIDYLHAPRGALREAQALAAAAFGADHTFFLVNGSTAGNQGSLFAVLREGDRVLLPRASHRSVYAAAMLAGAEPIYVPPTVHPSAGVVLAVDVDAARAAAAAVGDVRAVHLTSPSYYGCCGDVAAFAALAHGRGAPLAVDEAHGAHFGFHPGLPRPALAAGADLVVQSTHKTGGSLTGSSMLHLRGPRASAARVQEVLALFQSSSPSALLSASLDAARAMLATEGERLLGRALDLAAGARERLRRLPGMTCYGDELIGAGGVYDLDRTKLIVRLDRGMSGFEADRWLRAVHGVEAEMADAAHLVFSITYADDDAGVERLVRAMQEIADHLQDGGPGSAVPPPPPLPRCALPMRRAYAAPSRPVPLAEALGAVSAEFAIPYPPGIPVLVPGEVVDGATVAYLEEVRARGGGLVGPEDPTFARLRVVA